MKKPQILIDSVYYTKYINLAVGSGMIESLELSNLEFENFVKLIDEEKENYKYGKDKWTIKQVIQHIIDVERLFVARALSIARDEKTEVFGFDENLYADNDYSNRLTLEYLINDYKLVRQATVSFFKSINLDNIDNTVGDTIKMSPRIIGWIISGHSTHHINVIKARYL